MRETSSRLQIGCRVVRIWMFRIMSQFDFRLDTRHSRKQLLDDLSRKERCSLGDWGTFSLV